MECENKKISKNNNKIQNADDNCSISLDFGNTN